MLKQFSDRYFPIKSLLLMFLLFGSLCIADEKSKKEIGEKQTVKIVMMGDSLTEGYGVEKQNSFPSVIQDELDKRSKNKYRVINSSVSGSTTASGLRRLNWILKSKPKILLVALGANDGLRGLPAAETRKNLTQLIRKAQEKDIKVILAGMEAPPNYGKKYTAEFRKVFSQVAKETQVKYIPFLLEGVAGEKKFNQADGIHPNEEGHKKIAALVMKTLEPLL